MVGDASLESNSMNFFSNTKVTPVITFANKILIHHAALNEVENNEITHLISLHSEVYSPEWPQIPPKQIYPTVV